MFFFTQRVRYKYHGMNKDLSYSNIELDKNYFLKFFSNYVSSFLFDLLTMNDKFYFITKSDFFFLHKCK